MTDPIGCPLVSFIICTYQRAEQLRRCLGTVLALPDGDIEIVVNDNASPDHTPAVMADLAGDPRIRYVRHAENIGIARNFLHAIGRARGTWLFLLTDDDRLVPAELPALRQAIARHPDAGMIFSAVQNAAPDGGLIPGIYGPSARDRVFAPGASAAATLARWSSVLSRQVIRRAVIDLHVYEAATGNAYFCSIVAARIALAHPCVYLHRAIVLHTVDNVQLWDEWGKDWGEIYFRTHMDMIRVIATALDAEGVRAPLVRRRWMAEVLASYAKLHWRLGPIGFASRRGWRRGIVALRERLPLPWWPWLALCVAWYAGVAVLRACKRAVTGRRSQAAA